jgi:hypothetical protein
MATKTAKKTAAKRITAVKAKAIKGATEVHRYNDDEVTEVFGKDAVALDERGFCKLTAIWSGPPRSAPSRSRWRSAPFDLTEAKRLIAWKR